jgi:predicted RND superfamily exporter protein
MRYFIVTSVFVWFIYAANKARQLGPLEAAEEFIPKDHPVMIPINILTDNFTQSDEQNQVI